jgi:hypothetical protein
MTYVEAEELHPGDKVYWTDPDNNACGRHYRIQRINVGENDGQFTIVSIVDVDGSVLECFLRELSLIQRRRTMASNYLEFSERIDNLSPAEKEWIDALPSAIEYEDNPDFHDEKEWEGALVDKLASIGIDVDNDVIDTLDMFPYFNYEIEQGGWWIYAEESAYLDHIAYVVQAFIKKFRPDYIFKLCWAEYCDKPRVGEFGGGWLAISKDEVVYGNTYAAVDEAAEALRAGSGKA